LGAGFQVEMCEPESSLARIGWICSYTPEELILAAGFNPVRLSAEEKPGEGAEAYLPPNICPYVCSLLDAGRAGGFDNLHGVVFVLSCDAMRRLADIWSAYFKTPAVYRLDVPRRSDHLAEEFYIEQLQRLRVFLEERAGRKIADADVASAILTLNLTRKLIGKIAALRKKPRPPLSGAEFFALARAAMSSDKERFNAEAERFIRQIGTSDLKADGLPRLLLGGCIVDTGRLIGQVEESGAVVVAEETCTGLRHYDGLVDTALEPLRGLARRYLQRAPCPRMAGAADRVERLVGLAKEYQADGVVFHTLKFCDLGQSDLPRVRARLEKEGLPLLHIDRDYSQADGGQLRTRLEAFAELICRRKR
jgi:benzoyl-CoA reductase subunit C